MKFIPSGDLEPYHDCGVKFTKHYRTKGAYFTHFFDVGMSGRPSGGALSLRNARNFRFPVSNSSHATAIYLLKLSNFEIGFIYIDIIQPKTKNSLIMVVDIVL